MPGESCTERLRVASDSASLKSSGLSAPPEERDSPEDEVADVEERYVDRNRCRLDLRRKRGWG